MSKEPTALLDANILYPVELRNLFVQLAHDDAYPARWTNDIHEEWIRAVLRNNANAKPERLALTRADMDREVPNCLIIGYEEIIPTLELPDAGDRHVLAAAIKGDCDFIITLNLSDFPNDILARHGIQAQSPDDFLAGLVNRIPHAVCDAIREIRARLKNPHYSVAEYLDMLERQFVPPPAASKASARRNSKTVAALRKIDPSVL